MPRRKKQLAIIKNISNLPAIFNIVFYQYIFNSFFIIDLNIKIYNLLFQKMLNIINQIENIIKKLIDNNKKLY